jgi:hypothetical protein
MDHHEARVFHVESDQADEAVVTASLQNTHHRHPKGTGAPKEHPEDAKTFFAEVARAIQGREPIFLVGPSSAKHEFLRYLQMHDHAVELRIASVETVDHPTNGQLVALAKKHFNIGRHPL